MNKCDICGTECNVRILCYHCKKEICQKCVAGQDVHGFFCKNCKEEAPRQLTWTNWEIDENVFRKQD